jgi:uncharacterized Tic20 family protein
MEKRCGRWVVNHKISNTMAVIVPLFLFGVAIFMFGESSNNESGIGAGLIFICAIIMTGVSICHFIDCYKAKKKGQK